MSDLPPPLLMPKFSLEVDEHGLTRVSVDGVQLGCVTHVRIEASADLVFPQGRIRLHVLTRVARELVDHLKNIPWLEVEEVPCGKEGE